MNKKYGLMLSTCLLAASVSASNAAVISNECTNILDGYGGYSGANCSYQYSFNLEGTVALQVQDSSSPPGTFSIFGTLTQESWFEEDYYAGSIVGQTTTVLNLSLGYALSTDPSATVEYTMTRVDTLFDYNTEIGPVIESLTNTEFSIGTPSSWLLETDGVDLLLQLNGNGMLLTSPNTPNFLATVNVAPVPVPAAIWLFASGLLGLAGVAKRKQNKI